MKTRTVTYEREIIYPSSWWRFVKHPHFDTADYTLRDGLFKASRGKLPTPHTELRLGSVLLYPSDFSGAEEFLIWYRDETIVSIPRGGHLVWEIFQDKSTTIVYEENYIGEYQICPSYRGRGIAIHEHDNRWVLYSRPPIFTGLEWPEGFGKKERIKNEEIVL